MDANHAIGIVLADKTHNNSIGNTAADANTIECNGNDGIQIVNGAHDNYAGGNAIEHNGLNGVSLFGAAYNNTVGGNALANANYIEFNAGHGVYISDSGTNTNTVQTNQIYGNLANGIAIRNGARANRTGGSNYTVENVITGTAWNGVQASGSPATFIGTNSISNGRYGVLLDGANTTGTSITGTILYSNGYDGIAERNGASLNVWMHLDTHNNGGLGVDKFANFGDTANIVNPPTAAITSIVKGGDTTTIKGTGLTGSAIDLYKVAPDPSGFGEGKTFVGEVAVSGGKWTISDPTGGWCYTLIELPLGISASEFGLNTCRVLLPLTLKNN